MTAAVAKLPMADARRALAAEIERVLPARGESAPSRSEG